MHGKMRTAPTFWLESLRGTDHLEDLDIDRRIILKWILGMEAMDWIHLAQDRDWWQAVVTMIMNLQDL
jgi:hypothetical protein